MGYIYLIEAGEYHKIGYTNNLEKRKSELNTGNANELFIIKSFKTNHNRKLESFLHKVYFKSKVHGEWFKLSNYEINDFLNECSKIEKRFDLLKDSNPFFK